MSLTTAIGGQLLGRYPPQHPGDPGPRNYIRARFTNPLTMPWAARIGAIIPQMVALASPVDFQFVANPTGPRNVKPLRLGPGTYTTTRSYLAYPTPMKQYGPQG